MIAAVAATAGRRRVIAAVVVMFTAQLCIEPASLAQQAGGQQSTTATDQQAAQTFDAAQLDALLAPIALYPDPLLTQLLIAVTFPLQIVEAARWIDDPAHKSLTGKALTDALEALPWDPSVKSLVPFPEVLAQLNSKLDWMQQLGFAMEQQQKDVLDAIQRLRRQAQSQGHLASTPQQVVQSTPAPASAPADTPATIVIEPAQPDTVYVPSYDPSVVYGTWPYPAYPPVALPPPPGYVAGTALLSGLAFGAGVAVTAGLWGWASPNWGRGDVNVNVNRWNSINANRQQIHSDVWSAANRPGGRPVARPPAGPVGRPVRGNGVAPNAIGRPSVSLPAATVNRPERPNAANRPAGERPNLKPGSRPNPPANRPNLNPGNRPNPPANRPNLTPGNRPNPPAANRPQRPNPPADRPQVQPGGRGGAFGGMNEGNRAAQFQNRGMQSRQFQPPNGGAQRGGVGGSRGRR